MVASSKIELIYNLRMTTFLQSINMHSKSLQLLIVLHLVALTICVKFSDIEVKDGDELNAIVMGDWGGIPYKPWATAYEIKTALSMAETAKRYKTETVFALGDNFYFDGVKDEFDKRFQYTFEHVFDQNSLEDVPWHMIAGNHDHNGNITAQLAYSQHSKRWNFPDVWYTIQYKFSDFTIDIVMIDTVLLCGNTLQDVVGAQPTGDVDASLVNKQLLYIEEKLSSSTADYLLVMGHYPVYSIAEHGPTMCLVEQLLPLLQKYNVTAYFSGHDHNLQHLRDMGINYFVSGAVALVDPSTMHKDSVPKGSLMYHWSDFMGMGGFATVKANKMAMSVEFHEARSSGVIVLYKTAISPRK